MYGAFKRWQSPQRRVGHVADMKVSGCREKEKGKEPEEPISDDRGHRPGSYAETLPSTPTPSPAHTCHSPHQ